MLARSCCLLALLHVAASNDRQDAGNFFTEFDHLPTPGEISQPQERHNTQMRVHFRRRQQKTPELRRFSKPGLFPPLHRKPHPEEEHPKNKDTFPSNAQKNDNENVWRIVIDEGRNIRAEKNENEFTNVQKDIHSHDNRFSRGRLDLNTRTHEDDKSSKDMSEIRSRTREHDRKFPDQVHLNFRGGGLENTFTKDESEQNPRRHDYSNSYSKDKSGIDTRSLGNENEVQKELDNHPFLRQGNDEIYSKDGIDINSRRSENNNKFSNYRSDSLRNENFNASPKDRQNLDIRSYEMDNTFSRDQSELNPPSYEYGINFPKGEEDVSNRKPENENKFLNENVNLNYRSHDNNKYSRGESILNSGNRESDNKFSNVPKNPDFRSPDYVNKDKSHLRFLNHGNENKYQKNHDEQNFWRNENYNEITKEKIDVNSQRQESLSNKNPLSRLRNDINARNNENENTLSNGPKNFNPQTKHYDANFSKENYDINVRNDGSNQINKNHQNSQKPETDKFVNDLGDKFGKDQRNNLMQSLRTNINIQDRTAHNSGMTHTSNTNDDYPSAQESPIFRQRLALGTPHGSNEFNQETVRNQDNSFVHLSEKKKEFESNSDSTKEQNVPNRFVNREEAPHFFQDHYRNWMHEAIQFPHNSNAPIDDVQPKKDLTSQNSEDRNSGPGRISNVPANDFLVGNDDRYMYNSPKSMTISQSPKISYKNGMKAEKENKNFLRKYINNDENEKIKHGHIERSFKESDGTFLTDSDYPFLNKDNIFGSILFQNSFGRIPVAFPETLHPNEDTPVQKDSREHSRVPQDTFLTDREEDPDFQLKKTKQYFSTDNKLEKEEEKPTRSPDTFLTDEEDSPVSFQRQITPTEGDLRGPHISQEKPPSQSDESFLTDEGTLPPKKEAAYRPVTLPPTSSNENGILRNDDFLKDDKPLLLKERYEPKNIGRVRWPPPKHAESSESTSSEQRFFEPLFYEDFKPSRQGTESEETINEDHQRKSYSFNPKKKYSGERTNDKDVDNKKPDSSDERPPFYEDHHPFLYFEESSERPPHSYEDRTNVKNVNNDARENDEEDRNNHFENEDEDEDDDENKRNNDNHLEQNDSEEESEDTPLNELDSDESPYSKPDKNVEENTTGKSPHDDYDQEESPPPRDHNEKEVELLHNNEESHHLEKNRDKSPAFPYHYEDVNNKNEGPSPTHSNEEDSPPEHSLETPAHSNGHITPAHSHEEHQPSNSNEESHHGHDHEEPPVSNSNEESPHGNGHEESPVEISLEESPHLHGHEESPVQSSHEESPHGHSHEESPVQSSHEESPHGHSHEGPPVQDSKEESLHGDSQEELPLNHSEEEHPPSHEESPPNHSHEGPTTPGPDHEEHPPLSHSNEEPNSEGHSNEKLPPPRQSQEEAPHSEESHEELPTPIKGFNEPPSVNAIDSDEDNPEENNESKEESEDGDKTSQEEEDKPPLDYDERPPIYESIKPTPEYEDGGSRSEEQASGSTEGEASEEDEDYEDIVPGHSEEEADYEESLKPTSSPAPDYEDSSSKPSGEQSEEGDENSGSPEFSFDSFEFPADVMESPPSSGKDATTTRKPSSTLRPTSLPEDCPTGPTTPRLDLSKAKRPTNTARTTGRPADEVSITAGDNVKMSEGGSSTSTTTPRPVSISAVGVVKPGGHIITKLVRPTSASTTTASTTSRPTLRSARIRAGLPFGARVRASPSASSSTTAAPSNQEKSPTLAAKEATALTYLKPPPLDQQHSWMPVPPPTSPLVRLFVG